MTIREDVSGKDIVELILVDHKPLKELIKILKKPDGDSVKRFEAFETFAPLLLAHAEPEEMALYEYMKKDKEMLVDALEGDTEHSLASQLIDEIRATEDENLWSAKVKVLAEMVEHHIKEEEGSMLPEFRKITSLEERIELGDEYTQLKAQADSNLLGADKSEASTAHI